MRSFVHRKSRDRDTGDLIHFYPTVRETIIGQTSITHIDPFPFTILQPPYPSATNHASVFPPIIHAFFNASHSTSVHASPPSFPASPNIYISSGTVNTACTPSSVSSSVILRVTGTR